MHVFFELSDYFSLLAKTLKNLKSHNGFYSCSGTEFLTFTLFLIRLL